MEIGLVLSRKDEKCHHHCIYFVSHQLVQAKMNYTVIEREALNMFVSVQEFRHYLLRKKFGFLCGSRCIKIYDQQTSTKWRNSEMGIAIARN